MGEWNKFWIKSLTRDKLRQVVMRDVSYEPEWVREMTRLACDTCPNLSEADIETEEALKETLEF